MNYRNTAVIATISNSLSDAVLDYTVNKFNYIKVLLYTTFIAFILQLLYGLHTEIMVTYSSVPYLLIHAFFILLGYICFVKALEYLPLGLIGLIESSNLFLTFFIDSYIGYIKITFYFVLMFALFIFSVSLFSIDCSTKENSCIKNMKRQGFIWILGSVLFYVTAPYLIKISDSLGANEIAINLSYYAVALPYFAYKCVSGSEKQSYKAKIWWNNLLFLSVVIGILESVYYVLETYSFINDIPTVVMIIEQMRIFLVFILSVIFKMDKFTIRKTVALILGVISVIGVYYS